jgi:uncharacterized membrane protein YpjA
MAMFLKKIPGKILESRKWLLALIIINIVGFFYGLYYYSYQLSTTPFYLWILVLDSPIAVLLFAIVCGLKFFNKKIPQFLLILTIAYVIKYGFWTMLVIWIYWPYFSTYLPEIHTLNFFLHFGMILEGIVLIQLIKPKAKLAKSIFAVMILLLINDFFDYMLGTVTRIPETHMQFFFVESVAASLFLTFLFFYLQKYFG